MCRADVLNIIFGVISTFAVFASGKASGSRFFMGRIKDEINGIGIEGTIVMVALCLLFYKKGGIIRKGINRIPAVIAAIFSIFMLIGKSYSMMGNWNFIFADIKQFVIACFVFCGYFLLFYLLLSMLFKWVSEHDFAKEPQKISWIPDYARKHVFLVSFMIIFIGWLPYLIAFFPGSVPWDGFRQLVIGLGLWGKSDHFPYLISLFYAGIFSLGRGISDNFGIALLITVTSIIEACCYAWVCLRLKQWNLSEWILIFALGFFAIVPLFGEYAQALIKDSLYFAFFALYVVEYVNICYKKINLVSNITLKQIVGFSICSLLVCLCRNNGIYSVVPANFALVLISDKNRRLFIVSLLIVLCVVGGIKNKLYPLWGVRPASVGEMLSIPFQQTARYLKYFPNDVTSQERHTLGKILDMKDLAKRYNPRVSDPVKKGNKVNFGKLKEYFKVWRKMFLRHPEIYVESFLHSTFGYIYPFVEGAYGWPIPTRIAWKVGQKEACGLNLSYFFNNDIRTAAVNWIASWQKLPLFSLMVNPATYTWLLIIITGLMIKNCKKWYLVVFIIPFVNVLTSIASPVNGSLRYAWPIAAGMPVIIAWLLLCLKDGNLDKQRVENMY